MDKLNLLMEDEKKKVEAEKRAVKAAVHDSTEANNKARDLLEQVRCNDCDVTACNG